MLASSRTIIRMWNKDGYHKDIATLNQDQVVMHYNGMETKLHHLISPTNGIRVVVDPSKFPEAVEFEVIVVPYEK